MFEPSKVPLGVFFLFVLVCLTKKDLENTRENQRKNIYLQNSLYQNQKTKNRPMLQPSELPIDLLFLLFWLWYWEFSRYSGFYIVPTSYWSLIRKIELNITISAQKKINLDFFAPIQDLSIVK